MSSTIVPKIVSMYLKATFLFFFVGSSDRVHYSYSMLNNCIHMSYCDLFSWTVVLVAVDSKCAKVTTTVSMYLKAIFFSLCQWF